MRRWVRVNAPLAAALSMVAAAVAVPTSHASQVDPSAVSVELDETELTGVVASIAHLAYHLGAIRQLNSSARGPRETEM